MDLRKENEQEVVVIMLFSSAIFLWLFLPLVFWANYFIQPKYSNILLLISSLIFYAWGEPYFVYLMILSIFVNWMVARGIYRFQMYKRMILFLGILYNLAVLLHFKYAGFGVQILNRFLSGGGAERDIASPADSAADRDIIFYLSGCFVYC